MANKIYTFTVGENVLGGVTSQFDFNIPANNRQLQIKSISLLWGIINNVTGKRQPIETNIDMQLRLQIGSGIAANTISNRFQFTIGNPAWNGNMLIITAPCHMRFDSFVVQNLLPFQLFLTNTTAANPYLNYVTLMAEINEAIIWDGPRAEREYKEVE